MNTVNALIHETSADEQRGIERGNPAPRSVAARLFATMASAMLIAVTLVITASGPAWANSTVDEYRVKAAFLFHFALLVECPADAAPRDDSNSILVCILGDNPFYGELENTVVGKQVGMRTFHILALTSSQGARSCSVLFISRSAGKRLPLLLATLRNAPVLTVEESEDWLSSGGMIRFMLERNKIRFEINRAAAESAKLKISSQLLLLAKNVVGGEGGRQL